MKENWLDAKVLEFIKANPGTTAAELGDMFERYFEKNSRYGSHRNISTIIARLRRDGKLQDVERCSHCGRALTRGQRNVPLYATKA